MKKYILLDTQQIELEVPFMTSMHANSSIVTQMDYYNAIQHVRVSAEIRKALSLIDVKKDDARLGEWVVTGKGVYVGTWSKRLAKYLYKTHHIKLDPKILSIITERVRKSMGDTSEESITYMFSKELWEAGTYGEPTNACWFPESTTSYRHSAASLLRTDNGGAIKFFYPNNKPRARCWYYNLDGSLLIFNFYDKARKMDILAAARLLSIQYGMNYIKHTEVAIDDTFVNGKSIYSIGNPPLSRPVTLDFALRHPLDAYNKRFTDDPPLLVLDNQACPSCGRSGSKKIVRTQDGLRGCSLCTFLCKICDTFCFWSTRSSLANVCTACAIHLPTCERCNRHYDPSIGCDCTECSHCGGTIEPENTVTTAAGNVICEDCYDNSYNRCGECDEVYHNDDCHYLEAFEISVCDTCLDNNFTECTHCQEYERDEHIISIGDHNLCQNCFNNRGMYCNRCDNPAYSDDSSNVFTSEDGDDETWCEGCVDDYATYCEICSEWYSSELNHGHSLEDDDED